jgi:murein DD-endopeptidase MepM/ murein hydrolase activator NlpD
VAHTIYKLLHYILLIGIFLFPASCSDQQDVDNQRTMDIFSNSQDANSKIAFFEVNTDTVAKGADQTMCALQQGEKIYFDDFREELGIWEFNLSQTIPGCDLAGYIYVNINDVTLINYRALIKDETPKTARDGEGDTDPDNVYESGDGFDDYSGPRSKPEYFPLSGNLLASYKGGGRQFGASRAGGRKHAANDLLKQPNENIYAVTSGTIIDFYLFYSGTYAIVVDHGLYVVRYGEVKGLASGLSVGSKVQPGQKIGTVGMLYSGSSMLHFEKYTGKQTGQLTVRHNMPYQRRNDLVSPTDFLDRLPSPN